MGMKYGVLWCMIKEEIWLDVRDKVRTVRDGLWIHTKMCGLGKGSLED